MCCAFADTLSASLCDLRLQAAGCGPPAVEGHPTLFFTAKVVVHATPQHTATVRAGRSTARSGSSLATADYCKHSPTRDSAYECQFVMDAMQSQQQQQGWGHVLRQL